MDMFFPARECCDNIADLSENVIQEMNDVLILQPAYLDIVTTKRKADEGDFGIILENSRNANGAHMISEVRFGSVARQSKKIQAGDEIVQVGENIFNSFLTFKVS